MQSTTTVRLSIRHLTRYIMRRIGRAARGHDTSQSRRITWRERERPSPRGRRTRGEKEGREREGREVCACLGAKSWASRAQAWPRLTLRSSRSEVILEHEPPSGSQPPTSRESPTPDKPHYYETALVLPVPARRTRDSKLATANGLVSP